MRVWMVCCLVAVLFVGASCDFRGEVYSGPATAAPPLKIVGAWPIDKGLMKRLHDDELGVTCWLYREESPVNGGDSLGVGLSCMSDWMLAKPLPERP